MKRVLLLLLLSVVSIAQAQSISGPPFIAVHGQAKTEVVPDIFPLVITLKDTSMDAAKTQSLIESYAQKVLDLTGVMKMPDRDVVVSNMHISPQYRYDNKEEKQIFMGNTYQREIRLRFRRLADLKKMIELLPQAEQVQLDTQAFEASNSDELRHELMVKAVEDARKTAQTAASAVGKRVGSVHNISNQGFNLRYVESNTLDRITLTGSRQSAPPSVAMREGTIELQQHVYILYQLVD